MICAGIGALLIAFATEALTATTSVAASPAGDGVGVISGYAVGDVVTTLSPVDPRLVVEVRFRLTPANARRVSIRLAPAGYWYPCTIVAGEDATCAISPAVGVASLDELRVVATS